MSNEKIKLIEQFAKLENLTRRYQMKAFSSKMGINPLKGKGRVLSILKMQNEIGQKELGYLLDISKQALADILSKLEEQKLIEREQSTVDKRLYIIRLTKEGKEFIEKSNLQDSKEKGLPEIIGGAFDCLQDEEKQNLSMYLEKIIVALEKELGNEEYDDYADAFRAKFFANHVMMHKAALQKFGFDRCISPHKHLHHDKFGAHSHHHHDLHRHSFSNTDKQAFDKNDKDALRDEFLNGRFGGCEHIFAENATTKDKEDMNVFIDSITKAKKDMFDRMKGFDSTEYDEEK